MSAFVLPTGAAGQNMAAAREDDLIARHPDHGMDDHAERVCADRRDQTLPG
jgi:hypothetical protein